MLLPRFFVFHTMTATHTMTEYSLTLEASTSLAPPATLAEYLAYWPEGAPYYEFVNGKATQMPAPSRIHQRVLTRLIYALHGFVITNNVQGEVLPAPIDVHISDHEYYQPDLIFLAETSLTKAAHDEPRINRPPDLVVEILSPKNAYHDLIHKKRVYEQFGVREYWIVAPDDAGVEVYLNSEDGFHLASKAYTQGVVRSAVLEGFEINIAQLFS